ncbi:MAG: DNA-3-methyladenine glycosylase I [Deltaproteobacteria bacterium]|nr:DNA-3-methyladenine glycosylase I [Deltaproteobacteria bacterium]
MVRCPWALADPLSRAYHDARWGRPCHDDGELFKTLVLEGMQAGLSWSLILKKESEILSAFEGLDPKKVAAFGAEKVDELMKNPGIIRNRLKINAAITNAKLFLALAQEKGSFSDHVWSFVESKPIVNNFREMAELPATTEISDRISRDLKKRGFKFIGSTIIYSFMQAMGLVNDHLVDCAFRFPEGQG